MVMGGGSALEKGNKLKILEAKRYGKRGSVSRIRMGFGPMGSCNIPFLTPKLRKMKIDGNGDASRLCAVRRRWLVPAWRARVCAGAPDAAWTTAGSAEDGEGGNA